MSDLICGLIVLAVAMPIAAWLLPKLNLYRDSLVCGLCKRVLPGSRNAHPRPEAARCRNCRIHERQQSETNRNEGMRMITDIWECTKCKKTVTASGQSFWLIRGDMMLRFRCTNCKARRDREPTEEEREVIAAGLTARDKRPRLLAKTLAQRVRGKVGAMRTRRANCRELHGFERQFLSELERSENLSEIARQEGNWRS